MWLYEGKEFVLDEDSKLVGFVYLIENLDNGMMYVGKKLFTASKTYQKNGKKRKKRVESNWNDYTGSNEMLNEAVGNGANIRKTILHLCTSRGWMSYRETQEILNREALQSDKYYNGWLSARLHAKHLV